MSRTLAELTADFEAVSKIYAERCGFERDRDWFLLKVQEEAGELAQAYLQLTKQGKDRGESAETARRKFEDEAGDLLGQLLIFAHHNGIDLEAAAERKWFAYLKLGGRAS